MDNIQAVRRQRNPLEKTRMFAEGQVYVADKVLTMKERQERFDVCVR